MRGEKRVSTFLKKRPIRDVKGLFYGDVIYDPLKCSRIKFEKNIEIDICNVGFLYLFRF